MASRKRKIDDGPKFYAVHVGSKPGVYYSWDECKPHINGFKGAQYKKFSTYKEAEDFVDHGLSRHSGRFYAVRNGRTPGIYTDWPSAYAQITGWTKPSYKAFDTRAEAQAFLHQDPSPAAAQPTQSTPANTLTDLPVDDGQPPALKKQKKSIPPTPLAEDQNTPPAPGQGPHPPMSADTFDTTIVLDPATGTVRYKTPAEYHAKKMQPTGPTPNTMLHIWTDGSALGNGQHSAAAGIGVYFGPRDSRNLSEALPPAGRQTNQRAELTAIQRAIELAPRDRDITIHSDSNYAIKCVTEWFPRWRSNNWKSAAGKPVENRDIIEAVIERIDLRGRERRVKTLFHWVKGHAEDAGNLAADTLAVNGARMAVEARRLGD